MTAFYTEKFIGEINRLKSRLKEQTSEYYEGMYAALKNEIPLETLADIERKIASVRKYGSTHEQWALKHPGRIWIRAGDRKLAVPPLWREKERL